MLLSSSYSHQFRVRIEEILFTKILSFWHLHQKHVFSFLNIVHFHFLCWIPKQIGCKMKLIFYYLCSCQFFLITLKNISSWSLFIIFIFSKYFLKIVYPLKAGMTSASHNYFYKSTHEGWNYEVKIVQIST